MNHYIYHAAYSVLNFLQQIFESSLVLLVAEVDLQAFQLQTDIKVQEIVITNSLRGSTFGLTFTPKVIAREVSSDLGLHFLNIRLRQYTSVDLSTKSTDGQWN